MRVGSTLANQEGSFHIAATGAGTYRVYAERIGYDRIEGEPFTLVVGQVHTVALRAAVQAIDLSGLTVTAEARCRPRPGSGPETARLWEEVRKALEMAQWSGSQGVLRMAVVGRTRELDARTLRVEDGEEQGRLGYYDGSPYRSLPVERLHGGGYIQQAPDGSYDYYAPDAGVLLSDVFLDAHCFRVVEAPDDDADLIGLGFEPLPGRELPDIAGTLWVDRGTAELRRVDFRYTSIPHLPGRWPQIGGRVSFDRLANGMWIVDDWYIRMPLEMAQTRTPTGPGDAVLNRLYETGGAVQSVRTLGGDLIAEAEGATVFGTAFDSIAGEPLAGATVRLDGTELETITGPDGAWRLTAPAGRYGVTVEHADLALLGLPPVHAEVTLEAGHAVRQHLAVPSPEAIVAAACADLLPYRAPRLVYGLVRDAGGARVVPGAIVRLGVDGGREVRADSTGAYRGCVQAADPNVFVSATMAGRIDRREPRAFPAPGALVRADVELDAAITTVEHDTRSTGEARFWSNSIVGTVATPEGEPIAGAVVELLLTDGDAVASTVSNERGRFELRHPDLGDIYVLRVTRPGYGTATQDVRFRPAEQLELDVELTRRQP